MPYSASALAGNGRTLPPRASRGWIIDQLRSSGRRHYSKVNDEVQFRVTAAPLHLHQHLLVIIFCGLRSFAPRLKFYVIFFK